MSFTVEFAAFDNAVRPALRLPTTPARVCQATGAVFLKDVDLARTAGTPNEQYYKWQLVYGLIQTGRVPADNVGCELSVPRGSKGSSSLYIDVAIFSDSKWIQMYDDLRAGRGTASWDDLLDLVVACGEIKADPKDNTENTVSRQLLPALNATTAPYSLGFYFNAGHLLLVARQSTSTGVTTLRLDPAKQGSSGSKVGRLNVYLPDSWETFPSLNRILARGAAPATTRAHRRVADLDVISSRSQGPVESALKSINRVLDATSQRAEVGYRIVIEALAAKVFDEHRSLAGHDLEFFIDPGEMPSSNSIRGKAATFRDRIKQIHQQARPRYPSILDQSVINWGSATHLKIIGEVTRGFQDISLTRSDQGDLYQVVFYNFAGPLSKIAQAQFLTPIRVIEFMVDVVNPRQGELVFDPTMGIADFLAVAYARARQLGSPLVDSDLYGVDNDSNMLMLAGLNMLLNGDGAAQLRHIADSGSLDHKLAIDSATNQVVGYELDAAANRNGDWKLPSGSGYINVEFDVVLTNPPFGQDRALKFDEPDNGPRNRQIASLYEVAENVAGQQIDKGILFLENAVRVLKEGGRFAIILSRSIASVGDYAFARSWLADRCRLVAAFDLPKNVFAETGVPTTVLVGYRPSAARLKQLQAADYEVFIHEIKRPGFAKIEKSRVTSLVPKFVVDASSGRVVHDPKTGEPVVDEEFSEVIGEFRKWARTQEPELTAAFKP